MTQQDKPCLKTPSSPLAPFISRHFISRLGARLLSGVVLPGIIMSAGMAYAQVPPAQTGIASPGRIQEQLPPTHLEQKPTMAPITVRQAPAIQAPEGAENIRFTLNDLQLDGVTAYTQEALRPYYAASLNQTVSLAEIYTIAAQLTNKYRNDGYILTQVVVPPQTIEDGNVRLQIVEGYVDSVTVDVEQDAHSEPDSAMRLIRAHGARIVNGYALNIRDLERQMLLINDLPGVSARGILAPSPDRPGAADLTILLTRDPFEALLAVDNYGTKFLGPIQLSGAAAFNSLLGNNERLMAQGVFAPGGGKPMELSYFAGGYMQPLSASGLKMEINATHTITEPGYSLDEFDVKGKASFLGIGLNYPVIRSRTTSLYTGLSFDIRNVDTRNNVEATRKDRIRALRAAMRLENLDTLLGAGLSTVDIEISQGLDILGATGKNDINVSRPDGDPTFTKLNVELQRLQRVVDQVNLLVGIRGQWANNALLSSEEFGVGGMAYGRGYDSSEILGDNGLAGKIELQWNMPTPHDFITSNQIFAFTDIGRVWNEDPGSNSQKSDTASSVGLGLRAKIMHNTSLDMTVAKPLNRDVQTMKDKDPRFFMSISQKF